MREIMKGVLESYSFNSGGIPVMVTITLKKEDFVPTYTVKIPGIAAGTKAFIETKLKSELISRIDLDISDILNPKKSEEIKKRFFKVAKEVIREYLKEESEKKVNLLASYLVQNTIGLGELEIVLADENLEEIAVNNSKEPVWIYHKKHGWCITNLKIKNEDTIYDLASTIARKVGRQINVLNPLLDAHLSTGDRVNSTLFPISSFGNTITIRKFSKNPWTVTTLVNNKTISSEVMALIWLAIQNELSLIVTGGTGSGKTSFLNAISSFIQPTHRIVSIEDTRELTLPKYLHWVPLVTREPNPEGKGEVSMLDLLVNSLRMRPDRIIVGEIRRKREAEILFEAMHTGHSVYATLHADNAEQTISRLTTPPIDLPREVLDALAGIVVQLRHRRFNIRRTIEFAEVHKNGKLNMIYQWDAKNDIIKQVNPLERISDLLNLYAGLSPKEIEKEVEEKKKIIEWMVENKYFGIDEVGHIVANYYRDPDYVIEFVEKKKKWIF